MKIKRTISVLLCTIFFLSVLSGCEFGQSGATIKWGIFTYSEMDLEELENSLNDRLKELQKTYGVEIECFNFSDYKDDSTKAIDYEKLYNDFDIFYLENGFEGNGSTANSPDIINCVENGCFLSLDDIFSEEQQEAILNEYVLEENLDYGKFDGVQYVYPTNRSSVKNPSVVGTSFGVKTDLFEEADLPIEEYKVDITEADQLLEKLSQYSGTLIYLPTDSNLNLTESGTNNDNGYSLPYSVYGLNYLVPQNLLYYLDTYTYLFPASGVGMTREAEPRVFNLFSDQYFIDYVKAMVRYREKGYTTQLNSFDINNSMGHGRKDLTIVNGDWTLIPSGSEEYVYYSPESIQKTSLCCLAISSKTDKKEEATAFLYDLITDRDVKSSLHNNVFQCYVCLFDEEIGDNMEFCPKDENGDRIAPYLEALESAQEIDKVNGFDLTGLEDIKEDIDLYICEITKNFFYNNGVLADENGNITEESIEKNMAEIAQHLEEIGIQQIIDRIEEQIY